MRQYLFKYVLTSNYTRGFFPLSFEWDAGLIESIRSSGQESQELIEETRTDKTREREKKNRCRVISWIFTVYITELNLRGLKVKWKWKWKVEVEARSAQAFLN